MRAGIYKPGQGYWTRLMTAMSFGLLVLMGVAWLWNQLATVSIGKIEPVYVQGATAVVIIAVFGWLSYDLIYRRHKLGDFFIATEGEMKKVNWSTRREIIGSTWVVIGLTVFIGLVCFVFDLLYQFVFRAVQVLEAAP